LICNKDVFLAINSLKSVQKYEEFSTVPVILHDDGSLTEEDIKFLKSIKNVEIIRRSFADSEIEKYISEYPNCRNYRLGNSHINLWHKIKTFDYYYFSKTKKILGMDTDLLFMKRPEDVIEKISNNTPFYFPDCQSAYSFNEPKSEIEVIEKVNTGLIYIPSPEYYNINSIERALSNLIKNNINYFPSWIEQSAYAHMFCVDGRYVSLDQEKYRIPYFQEIDVSKIECLHFVSYPAVRDLYETYRRYLNFTDGKNIFKKSYEVEFKDKKIPLSVSVYKNEDYVKIEFYWGLEKTDQKYLSHNFLIKHDNKEVEFKFQSSKNSYFIFYTKDNKFDMHHTYEWYGETDYKYLDTVTYDIYTG
jgi:hypothetical protein